MQLGCVTYNVLQNMDLEALIGMLEKTGFAAVELRDAGTLQRLLHDEPVLAAARNDAGLSLLLFALYRGSTHLADLILAAKPALDVFDAAAIGRHFAAFGYDSGEEKSRFGADGQGPSVYLLDPEGNGVELKGPPVR